MMGRERTQRDCFTADNLYLDYVGKDTIYGFLACNRHRLFSDDDFALFYDNTMGRPSVPPSLLAVATLLQAHDNVSDAEAVSRSRFDLRWKVALGLEVDETLFVKSTLQTFRSHLIIHDKIGELFLSSIREAHFHGLLDGKRKMKLAVDTTPIFGKGAVKDTYNLLADGIRTLVTVLAKIFDVPRKQWAEEQDLGRYFGSSIKGETDVDWSDAASKKAFLTSIVNDAARLLVIARAVRVEMAEGSPEDRAVVDASELLCSLLLQDIEPQGDDTFTTIHGAGKDRIVSTTDPESRFGRKSSSNLFAGHKAAVAVDTDSGIITDVDVIPGNAPDNTDVLALVEQSETNTGMEVETTIGDCAYGDGKTRKAFADEGRDLVAKVPRHSSAKVFPKEDFIIDLEEETVTCPAGHTTSKWRWARSGEARARQYTFPASCCTACRLRTKCTQKKTMKYWGRTITLHPQEDLLQKAQELQLSDDFKDYSLRRQTVEHRIARLVQLGIRMSRFFGRIKTKFQLILAATVANFTLVLGKIQEDVQLKAA